MSPTEPAYDAVPLLGTAGVATDEPHHLGEGPTWDPSRERLLWVDIEAGTVHTGRPGVRGIRPHLWAGR